MVERANPERRAGIETGCCAATRSNGTAAHCPQGGKPRGQFGLADRAQNIAFAKSCPQEGFFFHDVAALTPAPVNMR